MEGMTSMDEHVYETASIAEREMVAAGIARTRRSEHAEPVERDGKRLCRDCREPIDDRRLAVQPQAVRCVPCQARHD